MVEIISNLFAEYRHWLSYLAIASIVLLILSILLIPKLIARIPYNYFSKTRAPTQPQSLSVLLLISRLVKNIFGLVLVISGIAMLVLPGQGLLTLFIGVLLLEFPGKHKLERYLVSKPAVLNSLNWIRRKHKVQDLLID